VTPRAALPALAILAVACGPDPALRTSASSSGERAARRAYDGAPPVMPHRGFSDDCVSCHGAEGVAVPGVGIAPPIPHGETAGMTALLRCRQCHVERTTEGVFRESRFVGRRSEGVSERAHAMAPPVMPHRAFLRERCDSCHVGPAARPEIRTSHPERTRCRQCHVEQRGAGRFQAG
jgi:nitrate reductase (cytochrome), electron transfer subunit